jgi:hypothetical protein
MTLLRLIGFAILVGFLIWLKRSDRNGSEERI